MKRMDPSFFGEVTGVQVVRDFLRSRADVVELDEFDDSRMVKLR